MLRFEPREDTSHDMEEKLAIFERELLKLRQEKEVSYKLSN